MESRALPARTIGSSTLGRRVGRDAGASSTRQTKALSVFAAADPDGAS
jgi:hypothetical protein